jgi:uncharacterized protein (TIGR03067 family)
MRLTQIVCPKCNAALNSKAGIEEGTAIACPKCKQKFTVAAPEEEDNFEVVDEEEEEAPAKKSPRENGKPQLKKGKPTNDADDEIVDDDKQAVEEEADEEEKPKPKKAATDESKPIKPKKKRKKKRDEPELSAYGKLKNNVVVRIGVLAVLLAGLGLAIYIYLNREPPPPIVVHEKAKEEDFSKPIKPDPLKNISSEQKDAEAVKFRGEWVATSLVVDGVKCPESALQNYRYTVRPDLIPGPANPPPANPPPKNDPKADPNKVEPVRPDLWLFRYDSRYSSHVKIDAAKKPAELDLTSVLTKTMVPAIYRFINKDTLEICCRREPGDRPTEFAAGAGSRCLLMTLKRDTSPAKSGLFTSDAQRFQGNWLLSMVRSAGIHFTPDSRLADNATGALATFAKCVVQQGRLEKTRIFITGDDWIITDEPEGGDRYTFDKNTNPGEIDFVRSDGVTLLGIYRFSENDSTLEICVSWKGDRPKDFSPALDSECLICTLKRVP